MIDPEWPPNQSPLRVALINETARLIVEAKAAADGRNDVRWDHGTAEQQRAVIDDVTDFFYAADLAMGSLLERGRQN